MDHSQQEAGQNPEGTAQKKRQIINEEPAQKPARDSVIQMLGLSSLTKIFSETGSKKKINEPSQTDIMFFERQDNFSSECLTHAINNLLGQSRLKKADMVRMCNILSQDVINPHKHFLGGDYDANVLLLAMEQLGKTCIWFDKRKKFTFRQEEEDELLQGYLVNIKKGQKLYQKVLGLSSRHWIALKWVRGAYYVFYDSQKKQPKIIGDRDMAITQINTWISEGGELFEIYR